MFSVLSVSAAVAFFSSLTNADAAAFGLDMISNGRYWWGGSWQHRPASGNTGNCLCVKGTNNSNRRVEGYCYKGLDFNEHIEEQYLIALFDHNKPIDITIHGSDALWVDRFVVSWNGGNRDYGTHNTHGFCLSTDRNDQFDQYATHGGCRQTMSINPNNNVYAYDGRAGYYRESWLLDRMKNTCDQLYGRRRAEGMMGNGDVGKMFPRPIAEPIPAPAGGMGSTPVMEEEVDEDPAGSSPKQVHSLLEGRIVSELHAVIKQLVENNSQVTDAQIDSVLNSAMLMIEHMMEREEETEKVLQGSPNNEATLSRRLGA